ncbi:HD domain-containing protein [Brevibacillus sp. M2.1A]|uniref:HD domain-containing protein n=1 Tax=Brevibacillus TaxID=55080 RepID=UPI00156B01CB|nr:MULTISPECIES: HD domain-containing protein [Brevibacillus]MBY0087733.1 HD domain-containing protein [Brevibacillus brevis]MCC8433442.1 HD domain-containing protein [Brevibacillus sp. M2.1A]UKL01156.1 HD domain-containing protein [Brevibacillus brevis]
MTSLFIIPESKLSVDATHYVRELSTQTLFNHLMRTYAFGYMIAQKNDLNIDMELLYLGAIMHDLGLTEPFADRERTFEIEGGEAACHFLVQHGYPIEKAEIVQKAVELHATVEAEKNQPEIALVHLGVMVDAGFRVDLFPKDLLQQIIEDYPRLGINQKMIEHFTYQLQKKNDTKLIPIIEAAKHHSHFSE